MTSRRGRRPGLFPGSLREGRARPAAPSVPASSPLHVVPAPGGCPGPGSPHGCRRLHVFAASAPQSGPLGAAQTAGARGRRRLGHRRAVSAAPLRRGRFSSGPRERRAASAPGRPGPRRASAPAADHPQRPLHGLLSAPRAPAQEGL